MKFFVRLIMMVSIGIFSVTALHADQISVNVPVYETTFDQLIAFYQKRVELEDSESKILSDIGKDARQMLNCIQTNKASLIEGMESKGIYNTAKVKSYIINTARYAYRN